MAIFKPSQHSPNLEEVDLNESNDFSCLVNTSGEQVKAYKMTVLSEDGTNVIGDGYCDVNGTYHDGAVDLTIPLNNKKTLTIPNISSYFHKPNEEFINGKNYQWGVRTYNAKVGSTSQPNTKVCEGYLVGSTKYVIWSNIPKTQTGALDQLVYDRYIEFTAANANELVIGAHEAKEKTKPTSYPYIQRRKIDWVTKQLGSNEDYVKIEVTENFDYDYLDGKQYQIYQCSSDHTVKSLFADPNSEINVSHVIIVYKTLADAQAARTAGEKPDDVKDVNRWAPCMERTDGTAGYNSRKIVGYSSDTGEMRFNDTFKVAPVNGQYYRLFKIDTLTNQYTAVDDAAGTTDPLVSHVVGGTPITNNTYFKVITNRWDTSGTSQIHRLFIQPNINIKSDTTNPNELVFNNGVRINIVEQYWTNNNLTPPQKIDISFNKLDNTQWLLEDSSKNENINPVTQRPTSITDGIVIPTSQSVPIISQTDYNIYTDFADSMPYNILYARTAPIIKMQYRNALKTIVAGHLGAEGFYDSTGNLIINPSAFQLYHDVTDVSALHPEGLYYNWVTLEGSSSYVHVPSLLIEGKYNELQDKFYDETETIEYAKNPDWLYYDIRTKRYFICATTSSTYTETDNIEVVWVNVDSLVPREYREVEFRTLWRDSEGNTVLNPQIKNYRYSLYAYPPNNDTTPELIKHSKTYYDIDTKWIFRGLDGTPSADYSILNPHLYKAEVLITDEYDKEYLVSANFKIYYATENAPISINVNLLCDEQANQINVSPPTYAQSTDYESPTQGIKYTVTNDNVDTEKNMVSIPSGSILNYTQTTSGMPLTFPKNFSTLTKFKLTNDFIDAHSTIGKEAELFTVSHSLETSKIVIDSGTAFYATQAPVNTPYYLDATLDPSKIKGSLTEARPYTLYEDATATRRYGTLTLTDYDLSMYYINVETDKLHLADSTDEINNKMAGVTIVQTNTIYTTVTLTQLTCGVPAGTYFVLNRCVNTEEDNEEFQYRINVYGSYYVDGTKIKRNLECYYLKLYSKGPEEDTYSLVENCFYVNGVAQSYVNLMSESSSQEETEVKTLYAVQSRNGGNYIIAQSGLPDVDKADITKKYVLPNDFVSSGELYIAGVYRIQEYLGGGKTWVPVIDEDYVYLTNTEELEVAQGEPATTYEDLGVTGKLIPTIKQGQLGDNAYTWVIDGTSYNLRTGLIVSNTDNSAFIYQDTNTNKYYAWNKENNPITEAVLSEISNYSPDAGQINFDDDDNPDSDAQYIWLDNGVGLSMFKNYINNKLINLFLAVSYDTGGNRHVKTQVLLTNKKD